MLSKYFYWEENNTDLIKDDTDIIVSALVFELQKKYDQVSVFPVKGGTLGVVFELWADGKRKFIKTHRMGRAYRENLLKEITILSAVYGSFIEIERIDIMVSQWAYTFMITDWLMPAPDDVDVPMIRAEILNYQDRLRKVNAEVGYSFSDVIVAGRKSLSALYEADFLSGEMYQKCVGSIEYVQLRSQREDKVICHGDLSNVNMMVDGNGRTMIIDWEDALWAFPEYDFLYWLTFFSQRKYYSDYLLEQNGIGKKWGIGVMVLITLVKCEMSRKNDSYRNNTLSFQERLQEMYELDSDKP